MSTNTMAEDSVTPTSEIVCTPVQDTVISFQTTPVDDENSVCIFILFFLRFVSDPLLTISIQARRH